MAQEILEISDAEYLDSEGRGDNARVRQARLRVDARKWLLSKMMPRKYGDRVTTEIIGDSDAPLLQRIELIPVYPKSRPEDLPAPDDGDETPLRGREQVGFRPRCG